MSRRSRSAPLRRAAALAGLALVVSFGLAAGPGAAPAGAHEGDAVITIEAAHPAGTSVHYIVRVTWQNDGHPAAGATVTATGVAPDGEQLTPVTLTPSDDDGRYAGIVEYPAAGAWTVRVTSIEPTGSAEQAQQVTASPSSVPGDDGAGSADEGFAPADDGTGGDGSDDDAAASDEAASDDDSGSGMPIYLVVAAGLVVVIGALTALNVIRRNRGGPTGEGDGGDPSDDAAPDGGADPSEDTAADGGDGDPAQGAVAGRPAGDPGRPGDA